MSPTGSYVSQPTPADELLEVRTEQGIGKEIDDLSAALNREVLTDVERYILAQDDLFAILVLAALAEGAQPEDTETLVFHVLEGLRGASGMVEQLAVAIVEAWEREKMIVLEPDAKQTVIDRLIADGIPVDVSIDDQLDELYERAVAVGRLPAYVDSYVTKQPVLEAQFADKKEPGYLRLRATWVDLLRDQGVIPPDLGTNVTADVLAGTYDEFFGATYDAARVRTADGIDPLTAARTKGATADWDFQVDLFESAEDQGILPDNIRLAGAIDYIHWLGDYLGVFKIVDAIVLAWGKGRVDVEADTAAKLYRYLKLRNERSSIEDRMLLYKRVLNRGDVETLDGMVANENFPALWLKLMTEIARYVDKAEMDAEAKVSTAPIEQAVQDLQYNLTMYATGLATIQVGEVYSQLTEAFEILQDPGILDHFAGGRRKNMWTVIERIARDEFGTAINVSALRTIAVDGNRIFNLLADYESSRGLARDPDGRPTILTPAERLIIAQAEIEPASPAPSYEEEETFEDFDDWEA